MADVCKSYIQVNIFGKTLQQLHDNNTDLEKILMDVGCDQIWLGDMPLYPQSSDSGIEKSYADITAILNMSLSDEISPKHSTPQRSRVPPPNFSSIVSKILSRMSYDSEYNKLSEIIEESEYTGTSVSSVVEKLIDNTELVDGLDVQDNIAEIVSNLLKSVIDIICETETECDSSILEICENILFATTSSDFNSVVKSSGELPMFYGPHPAIRHSEIETKPAVTKNITEKKPRISTNRSVQNLMIPENSIEMEKERERKPLKRTTSEIRRNRRKAMKLLRNNTVVPNIGEIHISNPLESKILIPTLKSQISEMDYDNLSYHSIPEQFENFNSTQFPMFDDSERVYTDLTPMTSDGEQYCEIGRNFLELAENRLNSETNQQEMNEDSLMYNSENGEKEQESWVDQEIEFEFGNFESQTNGKEQEEIEEEEDIERDGGYSEIVEVEENSVSFIPRRRKRRAKYNDSVARNSLHLIKCEFEGCKAEYKWRPKYGKLRLLDHSMKHCQTDKYDCNFCDFKADSIRTIRAHENLKHVDMKREKMNVKEVLKSKISHEELKIIWEKCYRENLHLVGEPNNYSCKTNIL